jgi:hypothetical protein
VIAARRALRPGSGRDALDELDAVDGRERRGRPAPDLLVEPRERAHAVDGDPAGGSPKIVAEDLVAERPWQSISSNSRIIAATGRSPCPRKQR